VTNRSACETIYHLAENTKHAVGWKYLNENKYTCFQLKPHFDWCSIYRPTPTVYGTASKWRQYFLFLLEKEFLRNSEKYYRGNTWNLCKMNSKNRTKYQNLCPCFVFICHVPITSVMTGSPLNISQIFPSQQLQNQMGQGYRTNISFCGLPDWISAQVLLPVH
jgi:hypothetical protein